MANLPNNPPQQTLTLTQTATYEEVGAGVVKGDVQTIAIEMICTVGSLTDFKVQVQLFPDGAWYDFLGSSDWAATDEYYLLKASSTSPATLTAGAAGWAIVRLDAIYAFRLMVRAAANPTTVTCNWLGKRARLGNG